MAPWTGPAPKTSSSSSSARSAASSSSTSASRPAWARAARGHREGSRPRAVRQGALLAERPRRGRSRGLGGRSQAVPRARGPTYDEDGTITSTTNRPPGRDADSSAGRAPFEPRGHRRARVPHAPDVDPDGRSPLRRRGRRSPEQQAGGPHVHCARGMRAPPDDRRRAPRRLVFACGPRSFSTTSPRRRTSFSRPRSTPCAPRPKPGRCVCASKSF